MFMLAISLREPSTFFTVENLPLGAVFFFFFFFIFGPCFNLNTQDIKAWERRLRGGKPISLSHVMSLHQPLVTAESKALEPTGLGLCPALLHSSYDPRKSFRPCLSHSFISKKEIIVVLACVCRGPSRRQKPHSDLNRDGLI